jgi:hypothetical protein
MDNQRESREQQQNMNQSAGYMEDQESPQPSQQQNCKQDDEHISLLRFQGWLNLPGLGFLLNNPLPYAITPKRDMAAGELANRQTSVVICIRLFHPQNTVDIRRE